MKRKRQFGKLTTFASLLEKSKSISPKPGIIVSHRTFYRIIAAKESGGKFFEALGLFIHRLMKA